MKKIFFTLHGLLIGAVYGSILFALLGLLGFYDVNIVGVKPFDAPINYVFAKLFYMSPAASPRSHPKRLTPTVETVE